MAGKKKVDGDGASKVDIDDFAAELIRTLNSEAGDRIAFNLSCDDAPTMVKRWVSTGSRQLDYLIANKRGGGLPVGRVVEIFGPPSIGKSHIAAQICRCTQEKNGISVYIDTENATMVDNLKALGVNISRGFVYVQTSCTEEVFTYAESIIKKAKAMDRDVPVTIIWDSVAASSPKAELEGDYDQNTIGLQARTIAKAMRKIVGLIGNEKVLFVCLNQQKAKIGASMYEDPVTTSGGSSIPYASSVRIKLSSGKVLKDDKTGECYGINVIAKIIKNKIAPPFRTANFEIHFGKGIYEHEQIFDILRDNGAVEKDGKILEVSGTGAWKEIKVIDAATGADLLSKKFYKPDFIKIMADPVFSTYIDDMLEAALAKTLVQPPDIDHESLVEMEELARLISETPPG